MVQPPAAKVQKELPAKHALARGPLAAQQPLSGKRVALLMVAAPRQTPQPAAVAAGQGLRAVADAALPLRAGRRCTRCGLYPGEKQPCMITMQHAQAPVQGGAHTVQALNRLVIDKSQRNSGGGGGLPVKLASDGMQRDPEQPCA